MLQLKNLRSGSKIIYYFDFKRNYDVLKSKSPCILLNKNINFNKNETESKMESPTHSFRETNLVLQLRSESQIKSKTRMSWSQRKKKRAFFVPFVLCEGHFFNIYFITIYSVLNTLSEYTYFYISENITSYTFFCLFLKSSKAFTLSLIDYVNTSERSEAAKILV